MVKVKLNTSDVTWIARKAVDEPTAHGTAVKGAVYFTATIEVASVEHVKFAGAQMIRYDIGEDAPRDHNRYAMYPATYLVG